MKKKLLLNLKIHENPYFNLFFKLISNILLSLVEKQLQTGIARKSDVMVNSSKQEHKQQL